MIRKLAVLALIVLAMPLLAEETRQRYTVVMNPDAPRPAVVRRLTTNAEEKIARRVRTYRHLPGFAANLTAQEAEELRNTSGVAAVEPVIERWISDLGSHPSAPVGSNYEHYDTQVIPWGLPVIKAQQVWPVTRGEGVNVAVLDTGIDWTHPDLAPAYAGGVNILDETKSPMDDNKHGTHVAGIIAAADNAFGVVGTAPGVKLWNVKALDQEGKGYDEYTAAGIDWVIEHQRQFGGRWVINMSIGAAVQGKLEKIAVQRAFDAGIIMVAAAGNRAKDFIDFPAAYPGVIAVGATGEDGRKADFSSWGPGMPIVAPGVAIQSTMKEGIEIVAEVAVGSDLNDARGLIGSPYGQVSGKLIACGHGDPAQIPASVAGNIALIQRGGDLSFREKARNAKAKGAAAVVIWNHETTPGSPLWTLWPKGCGPGENNCEPEWQDYVFPLTVGVSNEVGLNLAAKANQNATVSYLEMRYGRFSGTSMSTPYVAGVAALLLSLDPAMNPTTVESVLRHTAQDTADPGWDWETAWGIVDALAAAHYVAPHRFDVPPPPYTSPRRRATRP